MQGSRGRGVGMIFLLESHFFAFNKCKHWLLWPLLWEKFVLLFRFCQFRLFNAGNQMKYFHGSICKWLKATMFQLLRIFTSLTVFFYNSLNCLQTFYKLGKLTAFWIGPSRERWQPVVPIGCCCKSKFSRQQTGGGGGESENWNQTKSSEDTKAVKAVESIRIHWKTCSRRIRHESGNFCSRVNLALVAVNRQKFNASESLRDRSLITSQGGGRWFSKKCSVSKLNPPQKKF